MGLGMRVFGFLILHGTADGAVFSAFFLHNMFGIWFIAVSMYLFQQLS